MQSDKPTASRLKFTEDAATETPIPKKQGRPKKLQAGHTSLNTASSLQFVKNEQAEVPVPKKRGRPRKVPTDTAQFIRAPHPTPDKPTPKAANPSRTGSKTSPKANSRLRFDEAINPSRFTVDDDTTEKNENVGVEAARGTASAAESVGKFAENSLRARKLKDYRAIDKAQKQLDNAKVHILQRQANLSSNPYSHWQQKRAIRKSYMAQKSAAGTANKVSTSIGDTVKAVFTKNKKSFTMGILLFAMLAMIMNGLSSCAPLVQAGLQSFVIATYPAEDKDIKAAENAYRQMEKDLERMLDRYPNHSPGYDEYRYELDEIWHDPHALISLVSARIGREWTIDDVYGTLEILFERQYTLEETITTETRYKKEWVTYYHTETDPDTGEVTREPYQVREDVPYTYTICTVTLDNFNLSHLPFYVLSRKAVGMYAMYMSVLGNREDIFRGYPHASTLKEYGKHDILEAYFADEQFVRLIEEAEKYLGFPYVWGGDGPDTSFDCSGFVSYVFAASGVRDVGRLGATGLYNRCTKITPEEARPGDLIFFQGTISGEEGISHVGIYVGDGWMIHCGSPLGYADVNSSYYRQHYFGYGRLIQD
jgi:Cell wall-associated hydrolases (invasion-associated proteins)